MKAARRWVSIAGATSVALLLAVLGGCANPSGPSTPPVEVYQGATRLTGSSFNFGSVTTFTSTTSSTFTITNTGTESITLGTINLGGTDSADFKFPLVLIGDFAGPPVTVSPTIAPGQSYTFNLYFAPSKIGSESANVTVNTDHGTATFSLSGTGTSSGQASLGYINPVGAPVPLATSGGTVTFPFLSSGTPGSVTFQISTTGSDLDMSAATVTNATAGDTWTTSLTAPTTVTAGSPYTFYVYVTYTNAASSATVTIQTSDSNNPTFTFTVTDPLT